MARGRIISIQVASDDSLNKLSPDAERLYLRTLPHLDRDGLITGHPMLLWAKVAPLRMELMDACNALVQEWVQQGLVMRYPGADGQPVLYFKGFRRHNANIPYTDEAPSIYPPPPGWYRGKTGLIPEDADACFRLASNFDPRSAYRKELEKAMTGREQVATTSRPHREKVEYKQQDQVQDQGIGGDVSTYTPTSHHAGNSERGYAKLAALLAETPDDDLRIGIDAIAAKYLLEESFTGWTRALAGWSREDLLLVLAMLKTWDYQTDEQIQRMYNPPGVIKAALKAEYRSWPILAADALADLAADIEDAVELAPLPMLEAREQFSERRFSRGLAMKYGEMTRERA